MRILGSLLLVVTTWAYAEEHEDLAGTGALIQIVTTPAGAAISIDGALVGLSPRSETLTAGVHTLTAELAGTQVSQTVSLTPGEQRKITLVLSGPRGPRPAPVIGLVTLGGGALSLGVGLLLRGPAVAAGQQVRLLFERGGGWDEQAQKLEAEGISAQNWSWVFTGAGAAVMASGLIVTALQLFGPRTDPPALVVLPISGGGLLSWGARW